MKNHKNTGVLQEDVKVEQYMLGASPIEFEVRLFDGNWDKYLPQDERQKIGVETFSCVSFSALNSIEIQLNYMLRENKITSRAKEFLYNNGYVVDGLVNLSDKFLAIMSDTTPSGNYLTNVAQTIRKCGCIPESMLPFGTPQSWEEYHDKAQIKDKMKEMGLEFLKYFAVQYEWVVNPNTGGLKTELRDNTLKHLRHAPLQIAKDGHATDFYLGVDKVRWGQYDTYSPFKKDRPWEYDPYAVMKILITEKSMYSPEQIKLAKDEVKKIMKDRKAPYFFRPEASGEAYFVNIDGSFKYKKGIGCPLFDSLILEGYITPISEELWNKIKIAEIK